MFLEGSDERTCSFDILCVSLTLLQVARADTAEAAEPREKSQNALRSAAQKKFGAHEFEGTHELPPRRMKPMTPPASLTTFFLKNKKLNSKKSTDSQIFGK
jgi:hypothetical protein